MRLVISAAAVLVCTIGIVVRANEDRLPERLSETGLYVEGQIGVVAPESRPFSPQYPLWTDGAAKSRWIYLPPGATIDVSDPTHWELPIGARLWKEFAFAGRKIETRMIWRASRTRWVFATYVWNADGTDAILAPPGGLANVAKVSATKHHSIPSVDDCQACHGITRPGPLGFNALQLSPDRDPNAIHGEPLQAGMVTLETLRREGRLSGAPSDAYATAPRIQTTSPDTRAALGYLFANCGGCHNGRGEIAALGPTLRMGDLLTDGDTVARHLVDQPTRWQVPGVAHGRSVVIDDEAPEASALLVRMRSRSPSSQMPPLGTVLRDAEAVERLTVWVTRELARQSRR